MNTILQKRIEEAAKIYAESEVNRMDNSKYSMNEKKRLKMFDGYDIEEALISFSKQILQNQWISVEEALPEEEFDDGYEFVFVIVKIDEETSCYDTDYIRNGKWEFHDADKVTHWAEIPSLKGGEK